LLNHMSLIKFIEYDFRLPSLNENVARSNNLLDFFDFRAPARSPIILDSSGNYSYNSYPIPLQIPLNQLGYARTGSYTGSESTDPRTIFNDPLGVILGIFVGSEQLLSNLLSHRISAITVNQLFSFAYLVLTVAILATASVVTRFCYVRRHSKARNS
jgi:hypothetical protein